MMSREREREIDGKRGGTKEYREEKRHCRPSSTESVNDSLSWWRDGEICRKKKKGMAGEYETRKDRQRSENQFVCSLVG